MDYKLKYLIFNLNHKIIFNKKIILPYNETQKVPYSLRMYPFLHSQFGVIEFKSIQVLQF